MKSVYIVTGANGFLGNNIVRELANKKSGCEIRAVVHAGSKSAKALEGLPCKIYECDVTNIDTLNEVFTVSPDTKVFVIHAAGIVSIKAKKDPLVFKVNIEGTKNIVEKTLSVNGKMIYISSVHAIKPREKGELNVEVDHFDEESVSGIYAKTKAIAGNFVLDAVKNRGLDACILHPSGMIGPNDFGLTHLTKLIRDLANGDFRVMVNGGYDFVDVRDVAAAAVSACDKGEKGECYILSNKFYSLRETADLICDIMGYKKIKFTIPMFICKTFAPLCEIYYNIKKTPPLFTKLSLEVITSNGEFCNDKAKEKLGYTTRTFRETIVDTIDFMKERGVVKLKKKLLNKLVVEENEAVKGV